jgi:uncharacterized protein YdeI (YjbR/CyaY-like superfamily)
MMGKFLVGLSAENRKKAGVSGGDAVEVVLQLDTLPRIVDMPEKMQQAFNGNSAAKAKFELMAPSKQKAIVASVNEARTTQTKMKRILKAIESLS